MFRTVSIIARLCRMTPLTIHSRVLSPVTINSVRFKYQNRGGGDKAGRIKGQMAVDEDDDAGESTKENDGAEYNLLDDK
jgi:hypothetical protein